MKIIIFLLFCLTGLRGLFADEIMPMARVTPEFPSVNSLAAVLMDATTGELLYIKNENYVIPPASLAKLMTIHIALNEVTAGRASLDDIVALPPESWASNQPRGSSLMFLNVGQTVTLRELILGMVIPSGNDAAVAVALHFAPSIEAFAERMNQEARNMGLIKTYFVEPSGISEFNMITALEFAQFCREYVRLHPEALQDFHTVPVFAYPTADNVAERYRNRPGTIVQYNHNPLLGTFEGTDGLKTGYINESGYNLALTAQQGNTRLISVILGATSSKTRNEDGNALFTWGFEHFHTLRPIPAPLKPLPVWKGKISEVSVIPSEQLEFTTFVERGYDMRWEASYLDPIVAPVPVGTIVGELTLYDSVGELKRLPIITTTEVEEGSFFKRLWDSIRLFFRKKD
ncbi:MAG: D-alanyl-D-alanine carboxypeptidase [Treponema sp.]|jgi:D-alanyl-D-alanine carboxypeptidase (penicillin-binding protein 5/6)|nr:D-alanyl-D-alanine carboxypeptidase [Treponema sp.]